MSVFVQVKWTVKHMHIGDAFFDLDAAAFLCTRSPHAVTATQSTSAQSSEAEASETQDSEPEQAADTVPHAANGPLHGQAAVPTCCCQPGATQESAAHETIPQASAVHNFISSATI